MMANVFVSHRGTDRGPAERLSRELRHRGHTVWLDEWELSVGDSILGKINDGLTGATYLVLCYSDAGSLTPWMGREWLSALAQQLNGANIRVLPVRLTGGEPPAILADIKYADLVADWSGGVNAVCNAIR
jgi:hypothetical protein